MALGARPLDIALLVGAYAGVWTGIGAAAGVACSIGIARMAKGLLFGVAPEDLGSLMTAVVVLALTAAVAAWAPSRRAARVDPTVALRYE
jgi:putative ABC transport system permease protein